jgi:hypothetical protein
MGMNQITIRRAVSDDVPAITALWREMLDFHHDRLEVRVATTNELSTAFWRKLGFEPYMESLRRPL